MSTPFPHHPIDVRLSDDERSNAMSVLGRAFAEGRLTIDEYDDRCKCIAEAQRRSDLEPVFGDLPHTAPSTAVDVGPLYTAKEVAAAHRSSKRTRAGIMALTTIGVLVATPILGETVSSFFGLLFFLIPAVFILLYVMKVGPAEWYAPSPRQLERQRLREIQMANAQYIAERRAIDQARQAEIRAQRQQLTGELTNEAMMFAKRSIDRFKK